MSPSRRHGTLTPSSFLQVPPIRLSSNVRNVSPDGALRENARYRNVLPDGWSTADHASRMLSLPGVTPSAFVLNVQCAGSPSFVPPANCVSRSLGSWLRTTRPAVQPRPVDEPLAVRLVAVSALEAAARQRDRRRCQRARRHRGHRARHHGSDSGCDGHLAPRHVVHSWARISPSHHPFRRIREDHPSALSMFRRLPETVLPFSALSASPLLRRRALMSPKSQEECCLSSIAAAAATYGVAMLVPDMYA